MNAPRPHGWLVSSGSGNGLLLSGNKPSSGPILIKMCDAIWYDHKDLNDMKFLKHVVSTLPLQITNVFFLIQKSQEECHILWWKKWISVLVYIGRKSDYEIKNNHLNFLLNESVPYICCDFVFDVMTFWLIVFIYCIFFVYKLGINAFRMEQAFYISFFLHTVETCIVYRHL